MVTSLKILDLFKVHRVSLVLQELLDLLGPEVLLALQVRKVFKVTKETWDLQVHKERLDLLDLRVSKDLLDH
jgi:hypothetical protein